ncbi:MAG: L-rhamnose mutarotase [Gemmatimonadaceae bacterium]|nr:L-rhamnose mutarotase [Gemmatimonadaceae bacterium]
MSQGQLQRWCLALDLKDDSALIAEYSRLHERIWPEIAASIRDAGIESMEIWRTGNRLTMVMSTNEHFNAAAKSVADAANPKVAEWEALMWRFQQPLPWADPGQKWVPMTKIFDLVEQP